MNLILPEKEKINKKMIYMYIFDIIVCVIAVIIIIEVLFLGNDIVNNIFGINKITKRSEQEEKNLKIAFDQIFDNSFEIKTENNIDKIDNNKDIVYTIYSKNDKTEDYEINVNIPYINIKNIDVNSFNEDIDNTFKEKTENILNNNKYKTLYTVKYKAYMENNILSLVIYSDLKQGTDAQRVIYQTFTYDIKENKKLSLQETLNQFNLKKNDVQNKINNDIKKEEEKDLELKNLGYNVYTRNLDDEIYKIENINEFFVYKNNIYIIFAYGNDKFTSQKDIVII